MDQTGSGAAPYRRSVASRVKVERHVSGGLYLIDGRLWTRVVARKAGRCIATGKSFEPRASVYRPITNAEDRSTRILAEWLESQPVDRSSAG